MPKIDIDMPIAKDMQVLYKTIAMGTDETVEEIKEILLSNRDISYDFIVDKKTKGINIHLKCEKRALYVLKKELNHKVGYVKEEIVEMINKHKLMKHLQFSPYKIDIKNEKNIINIYFDILIKKEKFKELKKDDDFKKYNMNMTAI